MREKRWLWLGLLIFLFPLSLASDRFCSFALTDRIYHAYLVSHIYLPQMLALVVLASIVTVAVRVKLVRDRLAILTTLASEIPGALQAAFDREASRLRVAVPDLVYVSANVPICFTGFDFRRPRIFVSRGFVHDLDDVELGLLAHHELVHVRDRHAAWNVGWHLAFAALVLPGFGGVERALRYRRELAANRSAAAIDPARYEDLLARRARERRSLCFEGRPEPIRPRVASAIAPALAITFFVALFVSHADFMQNLPYLATHHC